MPTSPHWEAAISPGIFEKAVQSADVGIGPYERLVNGRLQIGVLKAANADGKAAAGQQREDEKAA